MKEKLLGKNIAELQEVVLSLGLPKFTAGQIAQWMYRKKVRSIDEMTNLSKAARARPAEIAFAASRQVAPSSSSSAAPSGKYTFIIVSTPLTLWFFTIYMSQTHRVSNVQN